MKQKTFSYDKIVQQKLKTKKRRLKLSPKWSLLKIDKRQKLCVYKYESISMERKTNGSTLKSMINDQKIDSKRGKKTVIKKGAKPFNSNDNCLIENKKKSTKIYRHKKKHCNGLRAKSGSLQLA